MKRIAAPKVALTLIEKEQVKKERGYKTMKPRIFMTAFSSVYPLYVQKVERKGRAKEEVDGKWRIKFNAK